MKWLVANEVAQDMRAKLASGLAPSRKAEADFAEAIVARARSEGAPSNLSVAGDVAQIDVVGLLTERPDFIAWLFGYGNTTYEDIQSAIAIAEANPAVKRLQYNIASPGGTVAGLFETLAAIDDGKKPKSVVTSFAASAAYAIASRAGKITATTAATEVGSIGVAISFFVDESIVDIASTKAPKKRPDVSTEEGKATVREELDALHDLFVEAIAGGRGTTIADVNANFGQGGLLVAVEAKRRGMIDKILRPSLRAVSRANAEDTEQPDATAADAAGEPVAATVAAPATQAAPAGGAANYRKGKKMELAQLKAEHPEAYQAAFEEGRKAGHAKGLEDGVAKERDRVGAHLIRGKASGAMDLAVESVTSGAEMTETLRAKYDTAGKNRDDDAARQAECDEAVGATANAKTPEESTKSFADRVMDRMESARGAVG